MEHYRRPPVGLRPPHLLARWGAVGCLCLAVALAALVDAPAGGLGSAVRAEDCTNQLGPASDFAAFVLEDMKYPSGDVTGRVAVGGNATFGNGFTVGSNAAAPPDTPPLVPDPNRDDLIVGGNLAFGSGHVTSGGATYGGTYTPGSPPPDYLGGIRNVSPDQARPPVDFAAARSELTSLSAMLAALPQNGTVNAAGSTLTLTGTDPTRNVFTITAAQLAAATDTRINAPPDSTVIVNVTGGTVDVEPMFGGGLSLNGMPAENNPLKRHLLFNLPDATSLTVRGIQILGTLLAPKAATTFSGAIDGQIIVRSLASPGDFEAGGEVHNFIYTGCFGRPQPTATPTQGATVTPTRAATATTAPTPTTAVTPTTAPTATATLPPTATTAPTVTATAGATTTPAPTPTSPAPITPPPSTPAVTATATVVPTATAGPSVTAAPTTTATPTSPSAITPPPSTPAVTATATAAPTATAPATATGTPPTAATGTPTITQTPNPITPPGTPTSTSTGTPIPPAPLTPAPPSTPAVTPTATQPPAPTPGGTGTPVPPPTPTAATPTTAGGTATATATGTTATATNAPAPPGVAPTPTALVVVPATISPTVTVAATATGGGPAGATLTKTADVRVAAGGQTVTFTVTLANAGGGPLTNVAITDAVPPVFAVRGVAVEGGATASVDGQSVTIRAASIPAGGRVVATITTTVLPGRFGNFTNTATASGAGAGQLAASATVAVPSLPDTGFGGAAPNPPPAPPDTPAQPLPDTVGSLTALGLATLNAPPAP